MANRNYTSTEIRKFITICKAKGESFKIDGVAILDVSSLKTKEKGVTALIGITEQGTPIKIDREKIVAPSLGFSEKLGREICINDHVFLEGSKVSTIISKKCGDRWISISGYRYHDSQLRRPVLIKGFAVLNTSLNSLNGRIHTTYPKVSRGEIVIPIEYEG